MFGTFSEQTAITPLRKMSLYSDTLWTATVCEMLLIANRADLMVSKRRPVLLFCYWSHDQVEVETSNFACMFHNGRIFKLLKPTGHVMHQQFNIQQLYALPTLYLCVLYLSENKQRLVPLTA